MHTLLVILIGFVLLGVFVALGRVLGRSRRAMARAALAFVPVWAACALINFWIGVRHAGYAVAAELPILLIVAAVPIVVAIVLWRRFAKDRA